MKNQLKLSGGRKLQSPKGLTTRPTTSIVREAVMNIIGRKIQDCNWLDLCSGTGIMSCEALQRGARRVVALDHNKKTANVCKKNLLTIAESQKENIYVEVFCREVISFLKKGCKESKGDQTQSTRFDLVYLDPPYESDIYLSVLKLLLDGNWLKNDSIVICEHSSSIELKKPSPWIEKDRRKYGNSALLLVSPPLSRHADTDSMQQQIVRG